MTTCTQKSLFLALLAALMLASALAALDIGAAGTSARALFSATGNTPLAREIILQIRAPRVTMALLTGATLAGAGAVLQGLFRNALADPGLIGVSSGAALATTLMLAFGIPEILPEGFAQWCLPVAGMAGGFGTTFLLYAFARQQGRLSIDTILLAGIAVAAFCGALTGILVFRADDRALRDITFWTMGSLAGVDWPRVLLVLPFCVGGTFCTFLITRSLNALLLGETDAIMMGFPVERVKMLAMIACSASVGASVSAVGAIGFIGVVVPHLVRLVTGPDYRWVLPGSILLGAALLELSDTLARVIATPADVPVGIITAFIGAPAFAWLLVRSHRLKVPS